MPIHTIRDIDTDSKLVVWEIEESPEWFLQELHLEEDELRHYNGFRSDQRRVHWLAWRYILKNIVGRGRQIRIRYDRHNKPFLELSKDHISVSHSGRFATVILSSRHRVGIDIEQVHPRLHKVAHKFMNPREGGNEVEKLSTDHLCLHWCAKEALYKLYGERNLDFREHIHVLKPPLGHQGDFRGRIRTGKDENHYLLHAEKIDDYFMVFAVDNPEL